MQDVYDFNVVLERLMVESIQFLGRNGIVVENDESKFGHNKYQWEKILRVVGLLVRTPKR